MTKLSKIYFKSASEYNCQHESSFYSDCIEYNNSHELHCFNVSDDGIYKLLNFNSNDSNNENIDSSIEFSLRSIVTNGNSALFMIQMIDCAMLNIKIHIIQENRLNDLNQIE